MKVVDVFDRYIKPNKNAFMVLSGHVCGSSYRIDKGLHGNSIHQILQNYQCLDDGGGYIRLLEVDTKRETIQVKMYSPFYNVTLDDQSSFVIDDVTFLM